MVVVTAEFPGAGWQTAERIRGVMTRFPGAA